MPIQLYRSVFPLAHVIIYDSSGQPYELPNSGTNGNLMVAQLTPVAGWTFIYNVNTDLVRVETDQTNGSVTQVNSKGILQTGAASGSFARISSRKYSTYSPGMGLLVNASAVFSLGIPGSSQIIGLGNHVDGLFFGYNGTEFGILRRRNSVDFWTYQTDWNGDKLDGAGLSGMTLNTQLGNIYVIEYQSGFGVVNFYVASETTGTMILVHTIKYPNTETIPSILSASLPLFAEVENTSNTTNVKLETPSAIVQLQGILNSATTTQNAIGNEKTIAANTATNVITIRSRSNIGGLINRVPVQLQLISTASEGNKPVRVRMVRNATLSGTSYQPINSTNSVVEYDTAGTYSAGSGKFVIGNTLAKSDSLTLNLVDFVVLLPPNDTLTVIALSTQTSDITAQLNWKEIY